MPAGVGERRRQRIHLDTRHNPVEAMPIEVDHRHDIVQAGDRRVEQGLPDVALVELGVAEQGDEPRPGRRPEVGVDVAPGRGGEQWSGRAEPDRSGGEVDRITILGQRRVRPAGRRRREAS
jgi:hypothetical protein